MNEFVWLLRREIWEHRALVIVPAVFVSIIVLAVTIGLLRGTEYVALSHAVEHLGGLAPSHATEGLGVASVAVWAMFFAVTYFVVGFYLLDALYAERKDRSVLFWKSLPISDTQTVLSKLATAALVGPAIALLAALLTVALLMIIASIAVAIGGGNPFTMLWLPYPWLQVPAKLIAVTVVHSLWFLPFIGWLLFASASAKRTPFLLAFLVPVGVFLAEWLAFDTSVLSTAIGDYAGRFFETLFSEGGDFGVLIDGHEVDVAGSIANLGSVLDVLTDPALLVGLIIGAAFVWGAIEMRRRRVDAG